MAHLIAIFGKSSKNKKLHCFLYKHIEGTYGWNSWIPVLKHNLKTVWPTVLKLPKLQYQSPYMML